MLIKLRKASLPLLALPRYAKRGIALAVDTCLCVLTVWFAFYLRLGEFVWLSGVELWAIFFSITFSIPVFIVSGLYRAIFRYSGWPAMFAIARAMGIYGLLYISVITAIGIPGIPRTIGLIQPLLLFFAIGGSRGLIRYWLGGIYQSQLQVSALPRALIYGAGSTGMQLASALSNSFEMQMVGFLDDDDRLHGHVLNGQPIFSPSDLPDLIQSKRITHVLLAIPSASLHRRNQILKSISEHHVAVRTLPSVTDLAEGRVTTSNLRELDIDDLLGRESVAPNYILLTRNVSDKVVLVTGAGGSIGSELCRQIIKLKPRKLLLIEISEYALYSIHSELEQQLDLLSVKEDILLVPLLASVTSEERMLEIIDTWQPDTIYHAAAYKHVPLVEHNPTEGIKNNVFGTLATAQAAIEKGVSDFVLISTDKAVRPTNVMGASKRLAEICLQSLFSKHSNTGNTRLSMVRFGNVLGSSGSVILKFRKQIRDGGPITLTHPDITRYFMTIPEAAQLVIQAGAMAKGGEVFVLDMGNPVKIAELARHMIELSGLTVRDEQDPDGDIEIKITGLRPGEKLYEELLLGDNPKRTSHAKILRAQDFFIPWDELKKDIDMLRTVVDQNDIDVILCIIKKLVAEYKTNENIVDWVYVEQINCLGKEEKELKS